MIKLSDNEVNIVKFHYDLLYEGIEKSYNNTELREGAKERNFTVFNPKSDSENSFYSSLLCFIEDITGYTAIITTSFLRDFLYKPKFPKKEDRYFYSKTLHNIPPITAESRFDVLCLFAFGRKYDEWLILNPLPLTPPPHDPLPQEEAVGMGGGAPQFNDEFNRNGLKVKYVNVYGTGEYVFKKENIRCVFDREEVVLPEDLESIRIATELAEIKKAETGTNTYWNSNTAGLKSHIRSETNDEKNLLLHLTFYPSNYYRNLAMGRSLYIKSVFDSAGNLVTVKEKYLDHANWDEVVPILAAAFGVALSVITKDNFLIVAKRADVGVGSWRGNYHCAMNEGLDMRDFVDGEPDLFKTAERGLEEELGIGNNEISDIRFLTFGYDTINYQWGLHGMVQVNLTAQEVMNKASNGKAKDRREYKKLHPIKFNVNEVIRFLIQNTPWTPFCKVCTIFTLIQCFGEDAVDREIASQLKS